MTTTTTTWTILYTMQMAYQDIVQGERPWNALGNFLNSWLDYADDHREALVQDALEMPPMLTEEQQRWASFCAASVEYLCTHYQISCPDWVHNPAYILADPWFKGLGAHKPAIQARLRQETPEPFTRRNIYCGKRVFANKYELAAQRARTV
jgi:hypothetical protein